MSFLCLPNYYIISDLLRCKVLYFLFSFVILALSLYCSCSLCTTSLGNGETSPCPPAEEEEGLAELSIHSGWGSGSPVPAGAQMQCWTGHCQASYIRPLCPACLCAFVRDRNVLFWDKSFVVFVTAKKWESTKPASLPRIFDSLYSSLRRWFPNNIFTVVAAAAWALFSLDDFSWLACAACFP